MSESRIDALTAADIAALTREIYTDGSAARRMMMYGRPYICPFEELIRRTPEGASVLDVGCGDGLFLNVLGKLDRIAGGLGFDTSETALASARDAAAKIGPQRPRPVAGHFAADRGRQGTGLLRRQTVGP